MTPQEAEHLINKAIREIQDVGDFSAIRIFASFNDGDVTYVTNSAKGDYQAQVSMARDFVNAHDHRVRVIATQQVAQQQPIPPTTT